MNLTDRVAVPAQVMARQVGKETVILDLASGTYFGLDTVGARIWTLLSEGKTIGEICGTMLDEYEVEPAPLEKDVFSLLQTLESQGLVKIEEA
ncbi:MAG: PqqD family protein [Mesorhizobium sp.]|uniref:PqqD family protein n=1 Tax=Mesorhizobium sp. TaxID=1871066 RepID=UPI00121231AF|nr:PqqD family protein [Mesorhizobium sp.]TIQ22944.1 MAG: PqqD family protein [Mesorhizobium sp.]